jgi:hypothetical protein
MKEIEIDHERTRSMSGQICEDNIGIGLSARELGQKET